MNIEPKKYAEMNEENFRDKDVNKVHLAVCIVTDNKEEYTREYKKHHAEEGVLLLPQITKNQHWEISIQRCFCKMVLI